MIYLLTAIGLSPGGSTHLYTNNTQDNRNNKRTTQITTDVEECGPCPVFASFTLAFALQLRKKHGKTSVRVRKTAVRLRRTSIRVIVAGIVQIVMFWVLTPAHLVVVCSVLTFLSVVISDNLAVTT